MCFDHSHFYFLTNFAWQNNSNAKPLSMTTQQYVLIQDETTDDTLQIPETSMKKLMDCSKMTIDKQLSKLAKDGVIFIRAPSENDELRKNAMKLRNSIIKLLMKYQFIQKVSHPDYQESSVNYFYLILVVDNIYIFIMDTHK